MSPEILNKYAIPAMLLVVLVSNVVPIGKVFLSPLREPDTDVYLRRYAPLREHIVSGAQLGFVSDSDDEQTVTVEGKKVQLLNIHSMRKFTLVQYMLAPALIRKADDMPLIVTDFSRGGKTLDLSRYKLKARGGDGALLLEMR